MTETPGINGRYDVGELLGRGGMAEVRKATDTRLGRSVAIKRLRTDLAGDPTFQARFRREAQSAASLNHPAIVSVYDTGEEITVGADGMSVAQPFIVMEYVAGRTLREVLNDGRKLLPERALEITSGVLSALDYSHRMGIIHRDIKPANVMLTPNGEVKVMDFGIARAMSEQQNTMTQTSAVVGTAQYLSPEQARGENVDARSDIYSTGCLLFELLTGRPPFVGDSPVAVAYQHVREQAPRPSSVEPSVPPAIDAIVMKALAKNVEERYQTAAAMKADIDRYLAGQPIQAAALATAVVPIVPPNGPATQVGAIAPYEEEERRRRWAPIAVLILALIVLIAAAIFAITKLTGSGGSKATISVPNIIGMTTTEAKSALAKASLTYGTFTCVPPSDQPTGAQTACIKKKGDYVIGDAWYTDSAGKRVDLGSGGVAPMVPSGTTIDGTYATGTTMVTLPNWVGQQWSSTQPSGQPSVQDQVKTLNLVANATAVDSAKPQGTVVKVAPHAGRSVAVHSTVNIEYANGNNKLPSFTATTPWTSYQGELTKAGFGNGSAGAPSFIPTTVDSAQPKGTVVTVSAASGPSMKAGDAPAEASLTSQITVGISSGNAPPASVPDVTGATTSCTPDPTTAPTSGAGNGVPQNCLTDAQNQLKSAGFTKVTVKYDPSASDPAGTVEDVTDSSGNSVVGQSEPTNTPIIIVVSAQGVPGH
ncbi:MAG TPA: Stk1 family PASTA domain-containing Ser/Thr kinase [Marmoricola sp.]|nr:Stk1 family PASTA domain-containing Ser/Thr kinase [Marmoricola sp.]